MIKIVYLLDYPLSVKGGAQLSTVNTAISLCSNYEIEIVIITPSDGHSEDLHERIKVIQLESIKNKIPSPHQSPITYLRVLLELRAIIRNLKPDVLHSQMSGAYLLSSLLPVTNRVHSDRGLYSGYSKFSKIVFKFFKRKFKYMITSTKYNHDLWPWDEDRKYIIPNSVSTYFENTASLPRIDNNRRLTVSFSGRYTEVKNWPLVLEIIEYLESLGLDYNLTLAISVNSNIQSEVKSYENFKSNVLKTKSNNVSFYEELEQSEMVDFYQKTDMFLITSTFESFGKVAIEAMSQFCCVFASDVGGLPEVIGDKNFICELNAKSFGDKVVMMNKDRALLLKSKVYFKERFENNFTRDINATKHFRIYKSLI